MKDILGRLMQMKPEDAKFTGRKLAEGEKIAGVLPDDLKRFHVLLGVVQEETKARYQEIKQRTHTLQYDHDQIHCEGKADFESCSAHHIASAKLKTEADTVIEEMRALKEIFWKLVRMEFNALNCESVAIVEDGQVASIETPDTTEEEFGASMLVAAAILLASLDR